MTPKAQLSPTAVYSSPGFLEARLDPARGWDSSFDQQGQRMAATALSSQGVLGWRCQGSSHEESFVTVQVG